MTLPLPTQGEPRPPWVVGRARIFETDPRTDRALVVGVRCRLGGREGTTALFDTGARFTMVGPEMADAMGDVLDRLGQFATVSTRHGDVLCEFARVDVWLVADEGEEIVVRATVALPREWPSSSPVILGWTGLLERIRFAVGSDDDEAWIWFGGET